MDFLVVNAEGAFVGIQRKRVDDLVASIRGDRIARELGQAEGLACAVLVIEGDWKWDTLGRSRRVRGWTRAQLDGVLLSFQVEHGWKVMHTTGIGDTAQLLKRMETWFAKATHSSLSRRPKPAKVWGQDGHRASQIHALQSIDGIGPSNAAAILDTIGFPLALSATREELLAVPGLGPTRVARMMEMFT